MKISTCLIASTALLAQQASAFSVAPRVVPSNMPLRATEFDEEVDYDGKNNLGCFHTNVSLDEI